MRLLASVLIASAALALPAFGQSKKHDHDHGHSHKKGEQRREVGAHVHGSGALDVAIEDGRITLELRAPGADVAGFEGKAETADAKAKQDAAIKKLEQPMTLFALPAAAQCTVASAKVVVDQHDAQAGKAADTHTDYEARYELTCAAPDKATSIALPLFKVFPGIGKLAVQVVTGKGQGAVTITAAKPRIDVGAVVK